MATLTSVIDKLKEFQKNPMQVYKQTALELIHAILWQMAKHTIIDTTQARSALVVEFSKRYGFEYNDLMEQSFNYWKDHDYPENADRRWGGADTTLTENQGNKAFEMKLTINDDGLYAQEYADGAVGGKVGGYNGNRYPSIKVDGRDNSNFKIRHLTYVSDLINTGNFGSLEKLNYEELVDNLVNNIEYFIFN